MKKLSTGQDSKLGSYRDNCQIFGPNNKALLYFEDKIKESPNGENEEVIVDEQQVMALIFSMIK